MFSLWRADPEGVHTSRTAAAGLARRSAFVVWEIARQTYRWRRARHAAGTRLNLLRKQLRELPRSGHGVLLRDLDPKLDKLLAADREPDCELIIGDFDQDGSILPRFDTLSGVPVISGEQFMPRTGPEVQLVDCNGWVGVRKNFGSDEGRFAQELDALLHLGRAGCPVPRLLKVDWNAHAITTTFVPGAVVRELLAIAGASIRDRDLAAPLSKSTHRKRVREGREYVRKVMSEKQIADIERGLRDIHSAGFVLDDVKFGNIILDANSGKPVFIDLERALPLRSLPRGLSDHLKEVDLRKFRDHFGELPSTEPGGR